MYVSFDFLEQFDSIFDSRAIMNSQLNEIDDFELRIKEIVFNLNVIQRVSRTSSKAITLQKTLYLVHPEARVLSDLEHWTSIELDVAIHPANRLVELYYHV